MRAISAVVVGLLMVIGGLVAPSWANSGTQQRTLAATVNTVDQPSAKARALCLPRVGGDPYLSSQIGCRKPSDRRVSLTATQVRAFTGSDGAKALCVLPTRASARIVASRTHCAPGERKVKFHVSPTMAAKASVVSLKMALTAPDPVRVIVDGDTATVIPGGGEGWTQATTDLEYRLTNNDTTEWSPWVAVPSSPIRLVGLDECRSWSVELRGVNELGPGESSEPARFGFPSTAPCPSTASAGPLATIPRAPSVPTGVAVSSTLNDAGANPSIDTTASFVITDGGSAPVVDVEYALSTDGGDSFGEWISAGSAVSPIVITDLAWNMEYILRLRAVNAVGAGLASQGVAFKTPIEPPATPSEFSVEINQSTGAVTADVEPSGINVAAAVVPVTYEYRVRPLGGEWGSPSAAVSSRELVLAGLIAGGTYGVQVRAVNAGGVSSWTPEKVFDYLLVPSAPVISTVERVSSLFSGRLGARFTLSYPSVGTSSIDSIAIRFSPTGSTTSYSELVFSGGGVSYHECNASFTSCVDQELEGSFADRQVLSARAHNAAGWSAWSTNYALAGTPAPPTSLSATATGTEATVMFTAGSDRGADITGYEYRLSANAGASWTSATSGTASPLTLSGLNLGTSYAVQVRAINAQGTSDWSSSVSFTTLDVPGAPTGIASTLSLTAASVTFSPPASNGGSAVTGYAYQVSTDGGQSWGSSVLRGTDTTFSVPLSSGSTYLFRIAAVNAQGTGPWSAVATLGSPDSVATTPTGLAATFNAVSGISVTWAGVPVATSYEIRVESTPWGSAAPTAWGAPVSVVGTSYAVPSPTLGRYYWFQVRSANSYGVSDWSAPVRADAASVPAKPTVTGVGIGNPYYGYLPVTFNSSVSSTGGLPLTRAVWRIPGVQTDNFTGAGLNGFSCWNGYLTCYDEFVSSSIGSAQRSVYVTLCNAMGCSPESDAFVLAWYPGAPSITSVTPSDDGRSASVAFNAPANNGGAAITSYVYQVSSNGGSTWSMAMPASGTSSPFTATGLTPGGMYSVRVAAVNSKGTGTYSSARSFTAGSVPVSPTGLRTTGAVNGVDIAFTPPAMGDSGPVLRYEYQVSLTGMNTWANPVSIGVNTSASLAELSSGTRYDIQVRAVNAIGAGPWSDTVTATAGSQPAAPSATLVDNRNGTYTVTFQPGASSSAVTGIAFGLTFADQTSVWAPQGETTLVVSQEFLGSDTFAYPRAVSGVGIQSPKGTAISFGPPKTAPAAPSVSAWYMGGELYWMVSPASNDGGADYTGYEVQVFTDSQTTTMPIQGTMWSGMAMYTGMENPSIRVRTRNAVGLWSEWSTAVTVTLPTVRIALSCETQDLVNSSEAASSEGDDDSNSECSDDPDVCESRDLVNSSATARSEGDDDSNSECSSDSSDDSDSRLMNSVSTMCASAVDPLACELDLMTAAGNMQATGTTSDQSGDSCTVDSEGVITCSLMTSAVSALTMAAQMATGEDMPMVSSPMAVVSVPLMVMMEGEQGRPSEDAPAPATPTVVMADTMAG